MNDSNIRNLNKNNIWLLLMKTIKEQERASQKSRITISKNEKEREPWEKSV